MRRFALGIAILVSVISMGCGPESEPLPMRGGGSGGETGSGGTGGGTGGTGGTGGDAGGSGGTIAEEELVAVLIEIGGDHFCGINPCGTIGPGDELQLVARLIDAEGHVRNDLPVRWSSSDPAVAAVDATGLATGTSKGVTVITAEAGSNDVQGTFEITVLPAVVDSVEIPEQNVGLAAGETVALTAIARDEFGNVLDDVSFTWEIGNPLVAAIDEAGRVTGLRKGQAVVKVYADRNLQWSWTTVAVTTGDELPAPWGFTSVLPGGCGLEADGKAYCWGANHYGQMGVGRRDTSQVHFPFPEPVMTDERFRFLEKGSYGTCAIALDDQAWCWGLNDRGYLGIDATGVSTVPMPVLLGAVRELSMGELHSCAISTEGETFCWGLGLDGSLGIGSTEDFPTPQLLEGWVFEHITAGDYHTCALDAEGTAYCWGSNVQGNLGNGAQRDGLQLGELAINALEPEPVLTEERFVAIEASRHTCGLTAAGEVWCWGSNLVQQLAPEAEGQEFTVPRKVETAERFVSIGVGMFHSCGLTAAGEAWCWGNNKYAQLGDGTMNDSVTPVQVAGGHQFATLRVHENATCGVRVDGGAMCWGFSYAGEMGAGFDEGYSAFPWPVAQPLAEP